MPGLPHCIRFRDSESDPCIQLCSFVCPIDLTVAWAGQALRMAGYHMLPDAGMQVSCFVPSLLLLALGNARAFQNSWPFFLSLKALVPGAMLTLHCSLSRLRWPAGLPSHCLALKYVT